MKSKSLILLTFLLTASLSPCSTTLIANPLTLTTPQPMTFVPQSLVDILNQERQKLNLDRLIEETPSNAQPLAMPRKARPTV